jgi:hypothetical protein
MSEYMEIINESYNAPYESKEETTRSLEGFLWDEIK